MIQKNGITLITLIITIVLLLILTGVSISVGEDTIGKTQKMRFETDLRIINTKVSELVEEKTLEELNALGKNVPDKASTALGDKSSEGFRYFDKEGLEALGIQNIDREVIINFSTKEVIEINGIDNDGTMIYILKDWVDPSLNDDNTEAPTFNLSKKIYGLNATISIKDIEYKGKSNRGTISYKLNDGEWHETSNLDIPVTVSGTYTIKVTDSSNNSTEKTIEIALTNQPKLDIGMTPVVYDDTVNKWKIVGENSGDWYDYASDKAQWANVMLQDGLVINEDGTIDEANMGSMFVWIPRYMYKIPYQNFHTSNAAEIGIKFLKGTSNIATDNTNEDIENPYAESIPIPTDTASNKWIVHPAFTDGSKTNYSHGGWDKEITGIWVAKFEASSSTPNATDGGGNTTELNVKVLPNVISWRSITVDNIFTVCQNMNNSGNIYGLSSNSDTHMMKNIEWGAVAYLTQSRYGQERDGAEGQIWVNPNLNSITGQTGTGPDVRDTAITDNYNLENGPKASTTSNVYGIYDISGGVWEYVAAYVNNERPEENTDSFYANVSEVITKLKDTNNIKYVDIYPGPEGQKNNYDVIVQANNKMIKWGDAVSETSESYKGSNSWQSDLSIYTGGNAPVFIRGGYSDRRSDSGAFAFCGVNGSVGAYRGFRPICIIQ